jgi:hypothetical protein
MATLFINAEIIPVSLRSRLVIHAKGRPAAKNQPTSGNPLRNRKKRTSQYGHGSFALREYFPGLAVEPLSAVAVLWLRVWFGCATDGGHTPLASRARWQRGSTSSRYAVLSR